MPFLEDKRGGEEEIDAEHIQLYTSTDIPRKQRVAKAASVKDRLGTTRSQRTLKAYNADTYSNLSGSKRLREEQQQPIVEEDGGEWHYAEEEDEFSFIDAGVAEVGHGSMDEDEDQDVYAHSA